MDPTPVPTLGLFEVSLVFLFEFLPVVRCFSSIALKRHEQFRQVCQKSNAFGNRVLYSLTVAVFDHVVPLFLAFLGVGFSGRTGYGTRYD